MKQRVGFDIDGVIVDFSSGLYDVLEKEGHVLPEKRILENTFFWEHSLPDAQDKIKQIFSKDRSDFWEGLHPVNNGKDFDLLEKFINERKDYVYFVTSRPSFLLHATKLWLGKNLHVDNVNIVMGANSKADICKGLNLSAYIDDRYLFAYEIAQKTQTTSFMLSNPSNFEFGDVYPDKVYRVGSIAEYLDAIKKGVYRFGG